jgi:CheY-like chemotaxis protein
VLADAEQPVPRTLRVLVVEDDPSSRRALTSLLKLNGFHATDVATGAEAIECLSEPPLCVLLDLMLPDGNGSAVLDHIRRHRLPIRVAVTSGAADRPSTAEVAVVNAAPFDNLVCSPAAQSIIRAATPTAECS